MKIPQRCIAKDTGILRIVGVTPEQFFALTGAQYVPYNKHALGFAQHLRGARTRGIGFKLTFPQWWKIWQDSGHYAKRASGGYVMGRNGDVGPYELGNVYICSNEKNIKDAFRFTSKADRKVASK